VGFPVTDRTGHGGVELLYESLEAFGVLEADADAAVEAIATHEADLLAGPDERA